MNRMTRGWPVLTTIGLLLSAATLQAKAPQASLELARQLNQAFVEVAEKVSPTVVVINVIQKVSPPSMSEGEEDGSFDSLPPGFWRRFHQQFQQQMPEKTRSEGSGIILRENGYILTNRHVVEDAESIEVRLRDGRTFKATVRGVDPQSDVAVIKIDARGLPVATLADSSKTRVGEFAIAVGAPFSLDYSVTFGHVSAKGRSDLPLDFMAGGMDQDYIQTDANINPGNSGGPLVNIDGEVIGMNTLIRGLRTGIGFAIPSNLAKEVAEQLIAQGKFSRAWLGIGIRAYRDDADFKALIKGIDDGVVVASIAPDSPAAKSNLKVTDVIIAVDGKAVGTPQQLRAEIRGKKIGQPVTLDVFRQNKRIQVNIIPGEWTEPTKVAAKVSRQPAPEKDPTGLGLMVQSLTPELASQFGVDATEGVLITAVEKGSPAARKGLRPGDIVTSVNQHPVTSPQQFREAARKADLKEGVLLNLLSSNTARFEILK